MTTTRVFLRRWAASLALFALPAAAVAAAPSSVADDCAFDPAALDCLMNSDNGFGSSSGFGDSGGFQPGDLVLPAGGGPPQVAVAPAPAGGPVITAGGDLVVPGAPPIG